MVFRNNVWYHSDGSISVVGTHFVRRRMSLQFLVAEEPFLRKMVANLNLKPLPETEGNVSVRTTIAQQITTLVFGSQKSSYSHNGLRPNDIPSHRLSTNPLATRTSHRAFFGRKMSGEENHHFRKKQNVTQIS